MMDNANVGDIEAMASLKLLRKTIAAGSETSTALPAGLARTLTWLRANLNEPVHLDHLAQIADVHPRTLERHFRRFLDTTPHGWVRRLRLVRARQELINGDRETSITCVALASGFSQLGRFAAQYREHFGELPSQTLKRVSGGLRDCEDPPDYRAPQTPLGTLGEARARAIALPTAAVTRPTSARMLRPTKEPYRSIPAMTPCRFCAVNRSPTIVEMPRMRS